MSKLIGKIKRVASFHLTRSLSSRASVGMDVDAPSPAAGQSSRAAPTREVAEAPRRPRKGHIQKVEEPRFHPYSGL